MKPTVKEVEGWLEAADEVEFAALERSLEADPRKGVREAVERARRRLDAQRAERERVAALYDFEAGIARDRGGEVVLGLDEVGRGPLAGPLGVGAVVLPREPLILGLNDSKQLSPKERERVAAQVKALALAWDIEYVEPRDIDADGMAASLRVAFRRAIARIEESGVHFDLIVLDGNPLRLDPREVSVVHGDARCASVAAASVIAKVDRDALMDAYAEEYPAYGFESNKGYASAAHVEAIRKNGLCPIHRASFCESILQEGGYVQESLF